MKWSVIATRIIIAPSPNSSFSAGIIVLLSACYGLISLVAIFGNCLVIFVVWATRSMRNVTNFYIANLASADVFIAVFCIPFQGTLLPP